MKILVFSTVVAIVLACLSFGAVYLMRNSDSTIASRISKDCMLYDGDIAHCYEDAVSALYPRYGVAQIFNIIRDIRQIDPRYQFCHVLAHKIGERVVAEDPEAWMDAIPLNPSDGICSNGFIHGVVGGRFRSEVLDDKTIDKFIPDFSSACLPRTNWNPTGLDTAICYHGLGHLYMFITDADIRKALDVCEKTAPNDMRRVCIEGVFMQVYQPLEPDDFELLKRLPFVPAANTYRRFCAPYADPEYIGACMREAWPLFREEITSGVGAAAFCSGQPNQNEEDKCFQTVTAIIGRTVLNDPEASTAACAQFPELRQSLCYESVARAVLEENRNAAQAAVAICERADASIASYCIQRLIDVSDFIFGDNASEKMNLCSQVPDEFKIVCSRK